MTNAYPIIKVNNRMKAIITTLFWLLLCASCADEEKASISVSNDDGGNGTITLAMSVRVADMETVSAPATRTVSTDGNSAMQVEWGAATPDTRASKDDSGKKVSSMYLYQFDGTGDDAPLVYVKEWKEAGLADTLKNKMNIRFVTPSRSAKQTVYLVANTGVTIAMSGKKSIMDKQIAAGSQSIMTAVPAGGLPMCAKLEFDPMTVSETPTFTLKSLVAKVTYNFYCTQFSQNLSPETFSVAMKSIANGTSFGEPSNLTVGYTPVGGTKVGTRDLGKLIYQDIGGGYALSGTCYIPENIAGQSVNITTAYDRTYDKVVAMSGTFFELIGRDSSGGYKVRYTLAMGQPDDTTDFNVRRNCVYNLKVTLLGVNETDTRMKLTADFIDLSAGGTANCYIVTEPNKVYGIKANVRGNGNESVAGIDYSALPDLVPSFLHNIDVDCIWETGAMGSVISKVGYRNGLLCFTTGTATEGNAVIGIRSGLMGYLWSWHIWKLPSMPGTVTCQKYLYGNTSNVVSFEMMDRDLGAYNNASGDAGSIGLIYQWGRKDPFPAPLNFTSKTERVINDVVYKVSAVNSDTGKGRGTESYVVENPTVFVKNPLDATGNPTMYDWHCASRNHSLWGNPWSATTNKYNSSPCVKTIYDPCPLGYRVPPMDTWTKSGGSYTNNGWGFTSMASGAFWFPKAYNRASGTGAIVTTSAGYHWSSSPSSDSKANDKGSALAMNASNVTPNGAMNRASGLYVRCVKE